MCKHYDLVVESWKWAVKALPEVDYPEEMPETPRHVWPKYPAPIVLEEGGRRRLQVLRWGIKPPYARGKAEFLTNARDDSLLTKSVWKQSAAHRRCLIPAAGYFEPGLGPPGARGEVRFSLRTQPHFFIAGLWDTDPDARDTLAFTMVTTSPNAYAARFHDRMPVVLADADALAWLGETPLPDERLISLCRAQPDAAMEHVEIPAAPHPTGKITRKQIDSAQGELLF